MSGNTGPERAVDDDDGDAPAPPCAQPAIESAAATMTHAEPSTPQKDDGWAR
jgi:hypothetical protein